MPGVSLNELLQMKLLEKTPVCSLNSKMAATSVVFIKIIKCLFILLKYS